MVSDRFTTSTLLDPLRYGTVMDDVRSAGFSTDQRSAGNYCLAML